MFQHLGHAAFSVSFTTYNLPSYSTHTSADLRRLTIDPSRPPGPKQRSAKVKVPYFYTTFDGPTDSDTVEYFSSTKHKYSTQHLNSNEKRLQTFQFGSLNHFGISSWLFSEINPFQFPESPFDSLESRSTKPRSPIMARSSEDAVSGNHLLLIPQEAFGCKTMVVRLVATSSMALPLSKEYQRNEDDTKSSRDHG